MKISKAIVCSFQRIICYSRTCQKESLENWCSTDKEQKKILIT